ncbi:Bug family tripartite tricarboxylate transporter substrate binding protein [Ramlibacter sp.]|uniref:Bug family tripartite tricarboxylate transporter substrate binding protein n=1 Tax=Ramlibacter sp. TaxID=1917967 RepID=UPI003D0ED5C8
MNLVRTVAALLVATLLFMSAVPVFAQPAFPNRPLRLVLPWPPGTNTDRVTRILAEKLSQQLGQPVVVENRAGAAGTIGTAHVAKAVPDGYTMLIASSDTHAIAPHVQKVQYDARNDFEPLSLVGRNTFILLANKSFEPSSVAELVAYAKRNPNKVSYGTWGVGSSGHLSFASLESAAGISMLHVPFQGGALALNAAMGGQIDIVLTSNHLVAQTAFAGKEPRIKLLGIGGTNRVSWLPEAKTFGDYGLPSSILGGAWYGVVAPAGLNKDVRDRLAREIATALTDPRVNTSIVELGWSVDVTTPAEFKTLIESEYLQMGRLVAERGIK